MTWKKTLSPTQASQRTKQIALLAIFSALYIVLRFIPYTLLIGGAGGYLSFSDFLAPIIGILLGPYLGGLTVLIGNFGALGFGRPTVFPTLFGAADFIPDFVVAVSMGFLMQRKWLPVVVLNAGLLALFFVNPLTSFMVTIPGTSISIPFAWMHIAAFIVLLSPLSLKAAKWIQTGVKSQPDTLPSQGKGAIQSLKNKFEKVFGNGKVAGGLVVLVFIGTMMQHLAGNILFEISFGQISPPIIPAVAWPVEWTGVLFAYPIERSILIISAVLIGTPVIVALVRNRLLRIGKQ